MHFVPTNRSTETNINWGYFHFIMRLTSPIKQYSVGTETGWHCTTHLQLRFWNKAGLWFRFTNSTSAWVFVYEVMKHCYCVNIYINSDLIKSRSSSGLTVTWSNLHAPQTNEHEKKLIFFLLNENGRPVWMELFSDYRSEADNSIEMQSKPSIWSWWLDSCNEVQLDVWLDSWLEETRKEKKARLCDTQSCLANKVRND